ncbi:hypothetical protein [Legionella anisa]|uniref:hypothetical protein n=1 Tax=Legionella anisa TaxID=28082 RepID=UPI00399D0C36
MSLAKIYAEIHEDFEQRVKETTKKAKKILSKYPYDFDKGLLRVAVRHILINNNIPKQLQKAKFSGIGSCH